MNYKINTKNILKMFSIATVLFVAAIIFTNSVQYSVASTTVSCSLASSQNLKWGNYNSAVKELQKVLNMFPDTQVASYGSGSPGNESMYFGLYTYKAVIKFQEKYANDILAPMNLTKGTGYVGTTTRLKIKEVCDNQLALLNQSSTNGSSLVNTNTVISTNNTATASSAFSTFRGKYRNGRKVTPPVVSTTTPQASSTPPTTTPPPVTSTTTSSTTPNTQPSTPPPTLPPVINSNYQWGAYVGGNTTDIDNFESLVGKQMNIVAIFVASTDSFPTQFANYVGQRGRTLLVFWEPTVGYDSIINGSQDSYIKSFVSSAIAYKYPIIFAPYHEMNLSENPWGYGMGGNTPVKFKSAWTKLHDMFAGATNVKFAIAYNNDSVPDVAGNQFADYYPGDNYVDYVGVDGFNFSNPWQVFSSVFDSSMTKLAGYNKPVYIFSTASAAGSLKPSWITDGLGSRIKTYKNFAGWVWFNENKEQDWRVNSDANSLNAFKSVI